MDFKLALKGFLDQCYLNYLKDIVIAEIYSCIMSPMLIWPWDPFFVYMCVYIYFHPSSPGDNFFIAFRERGRERERKRGTLMWERKSDRLPLVHACTPTGIQHGPSNLGMCPDWGLNLQPFGLWDDVMTDWITPARVLCIFFINSSWNHSS